MISLTRAQLAMVLVPLLALLTVAGSRIAGVGASQSPTAVAPLARLDESAGGDGAAAPQLVVHVADALSRAGGPSR